MEFEHSVQIASLKHPPKPGFWTDEPQISVVGPQATECANDCAQTGRVEVVDTGQVEDQQARAAVHLRHHGAAEPGDARHVQVTEGTKHHTRREGGFQR